MAGNGTKIGTGYIQVMPEMKDFTKAVKSEAQGSLEEAGEQGGSSFGGGLKKGLGVAAAATAAASAAVVGFGASSVQAGMDFDASMSQVAATMGTSVDEIGQLRDFAQEMGRTTAFSATEAADALNYMALAGYDADEAMEMLPTVLNLAAAGGLDLASASDMVTDAQSALGLSMEESSELVDKMAKASSKSNTSVGQLGDAILKIGGTANVMSGGTTELATALGLLADNGIKGAEGGTHLRNILLSLAAPTEKSAAVLEDLGVQAVDADGNMRPLQDIMMDLNDSLDGLGDAEKAAIISSIFNKTDIASVNALLGTSKTRWDELSGAIDDASGAAQAMADTQLDNLAGDITLFKSALEGAKITISDQLTPTLRDFTQFGTDAISGLTEAFQEGGLAGAMDALGDYISEGLMMINDIMPDVVAAGGQLLQSLLEGIIQNLPEIVGTASEIVSNLAIGLAEALPGMIGDLVRAIPDILNTLSTDLLPSLIQAAIELVAGLIAELPSILGTLVSSIPEILGNLIMGTAEGIGRGLAEVFDWEEMLNAYELQDLAENIQNDIDQISEHIETMEQKRQTAFQNIDAQVGMYQDIKDQLLLYVDAEGKIKQGYEDEVAALAILAEQYGIHINIRDGQVEDIDGVIKSIDDLILKYQEEAYTAAETAAIEDAYRTKKQLVGEYEEAVKGAYSAMSQAEENLANGQQAAASKSQQAAQEMIQSAMDAAAQIVTEDEKIALSKDNLAKIHEQAFDDICYSTEQAGINISANDTVIGDSLNRLKGNSEDFFTTMSDGWSNVNKNITAGDTRQSLEEIETAFNETFPGLGQVVQDTATQIEAATGGMQTTIPTQLDYIKSYWKTTFGEFPNDLADVINAASDAGVQIPKEIAIGISTGELDVETAIQKITALMDQTAEAATEGAETGESYTSAVASTVVNEVNTVEAACKGVKDELDISAEAGEIGTDVGSSYNDGLASQTENIAGTSQDIADTITATMDPLPGEMNTAGSDSGSELDTGWGSWMGTIEGTVEETYNYFLHFFCDTLPPMMSTWGSGAAMNFNTGLNNYVPDIMATVDSIATGMDAQLAVLPGWMEAAGYDAGAGLYNGLVSWEGALIGEAEYIAWQISSTIRAAFNSHSPSRVMMAIGEDVGEGLAIGISDGGEMAVEAAQDMSYDIIDTASHYDFEQLDNAGSNTYMDQIITLLNGLQNLQVVMDSGEVVGVLAPSMSNEFERIKTMQGRG